MGNHVIEYTTLDAMVTAYNDAVTEIREAYRLLESAQERLQIGFEHRYGFDVNPRDCSGVGHTASDQVVNKLHVSALRAIIDRLGIRPVMSEKRWRELEQQLSDAERKREGADQLPPITVEAIQGMVEGIASKVDSYFAEAVEEVFNHLRPHRQDYKTNSLFEVGRKVILKWIVERQWNGQGFRLGYGWQQQFISSLDNVFHFLDGKGKPEGTHYGPLTDAITASADGRGETEYFRFKCYANQNLHLEFKRLDLLAELNAIAGGKRLKPHMQPTEENAVVVAA